MIPFRYQLIDGSLTSSTNKSDDDSNATTNLTSSSSNNQTKPNSTMAITKSPQNNSRQDSSFSSPTPVQNTSNIVITRPDQEEQQLSSSPTAQQQLSEGSQLPLIPYTQPIQEPQVFSPPIYPLEPSVIQSELLFQGEPFVSAYPKAPSLIQSLQNLQPLTPTYPQAPSLIQSQLLLQSVPLEPILQPSYSYPLPILLPETIQPIQIPPRILSYSSYVDSIDSLHIVGEVINESYQPMRFVKITATFYDAFNGVVGTSFDYTSPSTLQPGQRAPFDITASERTMPTYLIASYTLSADHSDFD
jgi:hypothetical protein